MLRQSVGNASDFTLSTLHLKRSGDGFASSMRDAIADFHSAVDDGRPPESSGEFGAHLVSICEDVARSAFTAPVSPRRPNASGDYDIVVLGGTGFIGTHLLRHLIAEGRGVGIMARNTVNLPSEFFHDGVVTIAGDVRRPYDVERAIGHAPVVINLAHGGGGKTYQEVKSAMVGSAEVVARACLKTGVRRLLHVGSIASLYLGQRGAQITGATLPDEKSALRSDYARAKAECDRLLLDLHRKEGLPVCILRPGLVVGESGVPFHSGLGFFNNDQHCIGWNRGQNPLPFVLVEDVAQAIWLSCQTPGIEGRTYNIVGDVRFSAREYVSELARAMSRPLRFHPQSPLFLWFEELGKWSVKRMIGRNVQRPAYRDLLSRGLLAQFDCEDVKRDLGWQPVADRQRFVERAIDVFGT
jgi:nucleoside-diphosphate-sugar epimerase